MHSYRYLVKEVTEKLLEVEKALSVCDAEKSLLNKNFTSIKQAVDDSFKRHIGTLQCRAKWILCHADSIYHLKEGSLGEQLAELELISNELKGCLEASGCEEIMVMAKNVLQNASNVALEPCENGSMEFIAHDDKMEQSIISFGDIDVNSAYEQSSDYDLIPDEGIVVVEHCPKKQIPIEMELKSIEMYHITAQSANSEKEDFERIEVEMQLVNPEVAPVITQLSQVDSAFEEDTDSSKSAEWLHPSRMSKRGSDFHLISLAKSDKELCGISECTNKVPLWLKDGCIDVFTEAQKHNSSQTNLLFNGNEVSANISHMDGILHSSNPNFLQINIENASNSVYSLDSALDSMVLLETQTNHLLDSENSLLSMSTNIDHFMSILKSPNSNFLRVETAAKDELNSNHMISKGLILEDKKKSFSTFHSNIGHLNQIFDTPHSEYLTERSISKDRCATTYIKMTPAVNHIQILEKQPDTMFLRGIGKKKMLDPELCVWLRGSSITSCTQCFDFNECSFNGGLDEKWIKTATDW